MTVLKKDKADRIMREFQNSCKAAGMTAGEVLRAHYSGNSPVGEKAKINKRIEENFKPFLDTCKSYAKFAWKNKEKD